MTQQPLVKKRKRDPAFSTLEKHSLINIVEKHFYIVECKRTDAVSNREKASEWQKIAEEFNTSSTHIEREVPVLKNLWENLKKRAKAVMTVANENRYAIGGGPPKDSKDDPVIDRVISLIKTKVEGLNNSFDSDAQGSSNQCIIEKEMMDNDDCIQEPAQTLVNGDWSTYNTSLLRTPKAPVLIESYMAEENLEVEIVEETTANKQSITGKKTNLSVAAEEKSVNIPPSKYFKGTRHLPSRRRSLLKESEAAVLAQTRIHTLKVTTDHAQKEHEVTMRLLLLQEEQEIEKLKQEKEKTKQEMLKTEILREQLKQVKEK